MAAAFSSCSRAIIRGLLLRHTASSSSSALRGPAGASGAPAPPSEHPWPMGGAWAPMGCNWASPLALSGWAGEWRLPLKPLRTEEN